MKNTSNRSLKAGICAACIILFVIQSYREVDKYLSQMTSVAIATEVHNDVLYPNIVVCPRVGFKEAAFPKTTDEFVNLTYSPNEIIEYVIEKRDNHYVEINMTEIATITHGMCVFLEIPDNLAHSNWGLELSTYVSTQIYLVERGQELCIAYGECPNKAEVIEIGDEQGMTNWVRFKAIKKKKVEG